MANRNLTQGSDQNEENQGSACFVLFDSSSIFTSGLEQILKQHGYENIFQCQSINALSDTQSKWANERSSVFVIGHTLSPPEGFSAVRWIRDRHPTPRIVFVSPHANRLFFQADAHAHGVLACVLPDSPQHILVSAIESSIHGVSLISEQARLAQPKTLTERERDVLRGLASGKTEKEIADSLRISKHTLHAHVKTIFRKLSVSTRHDAIRRARHYGWVGDKNTLVGD